MSSGDYTYTKTNNSQTKMLLKSLILLTTSVYLVHSKTVLVGTTYDPAGYVRKVHEKTVQATAIPLVKREQEVYFEYPNPGVVIKGVAIKDLDNGLAEPAITRGGLGFGFVTIKIKSERGSGLNYLIEIYA